MLYRMNVKMKINPVSISGKAIDEIKYILENKNIPEGYQLRIGIKGGVGCAGVNFVLGFDQKTTHDDEFDFDGVRVIIDRRHVMFLLGTTLDFHNGADARGFKFVKQNSPE